MRRPYMYVCEIIFVLGIWTGKMFNECSGDGSLDGRRLPNWEIEKTVKSLVENKPKEALTLRLVIKAYGAQ